MLVDTDVLIWHLRGYPQATRRLDELSSLTLSHGLQLGDALIAATALDHGLPVLTANVRHSGAVQGLKVDAFNP